MFNTSKAVLRAVSILILLICLTRHATAIKSWIGEASPTTAPLTCPARSLNYITESLPQQCLKKPWKSSVSETAPSVGSNTESTVNQAGLVTITETLLPHTTTQQVVTKTARVAISSDLSDPTPTDSLGLSKETAHPKKPTEAIDADNEGDSPLDNANFLSFEDWRRQNLANAGQSADQLGNERSGLGDGETRRRPGSINNALDALGEDTEIDIDFGGFVNQGPNIHASPKVRHEGDGKRSEQGSSAEGNLRVGDIARPHARSKDAGKTCKERSNYASFDCAATVLKTNSECKGSTSVLVENKDSYLLNECSAKNKFLIVELCNDILVDTVVLANFEFFSSMYRTFKVSVSDRYPVKLDKWRDLGTFEARNSRQVQAFLVENPLIWARYLRIEFLTHFGNEFYCPVSLLRVHGTTMMEEFNHDMKGLRTEDDSDGDVEGGEKDEEKASDVVTAENIIPVRLSTIETAADTEKLPATHTQVSSPSPPSPSPPSQPQHTRASSDASSTSISSTPLESSLHTQMNSMFAIDINSNNICKAEDRPTPKPSALPESAATTPLIALPQEERDHTFLTSIVPSRTEPSSVIMTTADQDATPSPLSTDLSNSISANQTSHVTSQKDQRSPQSSQSAPRHPSSSTKPSSSSTHPPPSNPTTQESFFKSVHKRLQLLESNSTLSLQYIEEQSRILRDAFAKVEKRQLAKTSAFLDTLNDTVTTELRDFRHQYDQLWQSTVLELSSQRAQSQQEIVALSSRLTILADEIVFQKRIAILQFLLILVCLGLVLFSRSSSSVATYLELPHLVQHAFKSSSSLSKYTAHLDTPPASPSSTRPPSRYGIFGRSTSKHGRGPSRGSPPSDSDGRKSPNIEYSPPTPESQHSGHGDLREDADLEISVSGSPRNEQAERHHPGKGGKRTQLTEGAFLRPD